MHIERAALPQTIDSVTHGVDGLDQVGGRHRHTVDGHAFRDIEQVWRGVSTGSRSRRTQGSFDHRGHRALAVRARDVNGAELRLRVTKCRDQ